MNLAEQTPDTPGIAHGGSSQAVKQQPAAKTALTAHLFGGLCFVGVCSRANRT